MKTDSIDEEKTLAYVFKRMAESMPGTVLRAKLQMKDTTFRGMLKYDYALDMVQEMSKEDKTVWTGTFSRRGKKVSFRRAVRFE